MRAPKYNLNNIEALKVTKAYLLMNKSRHFKLITSYNITPNKSFKMATFRYRKDII